MTSVNETLPELTVDERSSLKARANIMGITYPDNIPTEKLRERVADAMEKTNEEAAKTIPAAVGGGKYANDPARAEALKLIRILVICMDTNLAQQGSVPVFASNSLVPTQKKVVPFGKPFHVPNIIYQVMKEKTFQQVKQFRKDGQLITETNVIPLYGITVLDNLTAKEIKEIRIAQQAAAQLSNNDED